MVDDVCRVHGLLEHEHTNRHYQAAHGEDVESDHIVSTIPVTAYINNERAGCGPQHVVHLSRARDFRDMVVAEVFAC